MAPILTLTDGTTTIQLNSSGAQIIDYLPQTPDLAKTVTGGRNGDGGELASANWQDVTETARIMFDSSTYARSTMASINRLFELARTRQTLQAGALVYVKYAPVDSEGLYNSEILAGACMVDDNLARQIVISWTRRFYWQSDTESQAPMFNDITASTNTLTLYNQRRSTFSNVARIAGASVGGDLPTPARLSLYNSYNSADWTRNYYLGHFVEIATQLPNIIECDTGTPYNSSTISGQNVLLAANTTTGGLSWAGQIPSAMLAAAGGGVFRILAKTDTVTGVAGLYVRAKISLDLVSTQYTGDWVSVPTAGAAVLDLGSIQLPPSGAVGGSYYPLTLELHSRYTGSTSNVPVDFIQLTPTRSYRVLKTRGLSTGYTVTLNDDPLNKSLYTSGWAGGSLGNYVATGGPIMLHPGRINSLYLLTESADAARSTQLQVFYRARRLVI